MYIYLCVCLSPTFFTFIRPRGLGFGTIVAYWSEMELIIVAPTKWATIEFLVLSVCVSVCVSVCLSVRLSHFSAVQKGRVAILSSMVEYGPQMSTIDFGVNRCIFKVTGCKDRQGGDCSKLLQ